MIVPSKNDTAKYFDALRTPYIDYCRTVSPRNMAINLETAAFVWWMCDHVGAETVCDLGSGFTSYVLRRYARTAGATAHSVDDEQAWLFKTGLFLKRYGLATDGMMLWDDWVQLDGGYDVIVHDYSFGSPIREESMPASTARVPHGAIIFDDAQAPWLHFAMSNAAAADGLHMVDIWSATIDETGRFAGLAMAE